MKRLTWIFFVAVVASLLAFRGAATPAIGDGIPAAAVKMENVDDRRLSIADVAGAHGTLVIFSCNHCPW
ncbi:MAG: thioredoxin family protein, partial [Thermoanaerobaculales bacterium]